VYGERALRRGLTEEKVELESLEVIDGELAAIEALTLVHGVSATFAEMLTFLAERLSAHSIEPNTFEAEIELVGWLELYFDARPCVAVVGCNDGFLPESITADPFLPDETRKLLGLTHNAVRYARDCAVLASVLNCREAVQLVVGSRGARGEVIAPSPLLLSDHNTRAARVLRFYRAGEESAAVVVADTAARVPQPLLPYEPKPLESPLQRLSVTGISRYLECPYRFYLEVVKKLAPLRDDMQELDARAFGILGHAVLSSLTPDSVLAKEQDAKRLRTALEASLAELVAQRYGSELAPAVLIQVEQLRLRLGEFAVWQAQWVAQGWRVRHVEHSFEGQLETAHGVLLLSAKIDRIDEHPQSGELAVFDYKFQDVAKSAKAMHRSRQEFHNLQLPLYRMVMEQNGLATPARLGILALSGEQKGVVEPSWLDLSDTEFEEARTLAHDIAAKIQAGIFWPPAQLNAPFDPFKWICAVGTEDEDSPIEEEGAYE
jgi:ATP-dependent helicase/nuclease subunit B